MRAPSAVHGLAGLFRFWLPLACTGVLMSAAMPILSGVVARMPEPGPNLAAFAVAYTIAIVAEAPVLMLLTTTTRFAQDRIAYARLHVFAIVCSGGVTLLMALLALTPAIDILTLDIMGLGPDLARRIALSVLFLVPFPFAIGMRRVAQAVLIRSGQPHRVFYGTLIRLGGIAAVGGAGFWLLDMDGAPLAAGALSLGVAAEAVATRLMAGAAVRDLRAREPSGEAPPTMAGIAAFYWPLALTAVMGVAAAPVAAAFMATGRMAVESLALFPLALGLVHIVRAVAQSYLEVVVALAGPSGERLPLLRRFALLLAAGSTALVALVAFTPLAGLVLRDAAGLPPALAAFAVDPLRMLVPFAALAVLQVWQRARLVLDRRTLPITPAAGIDMAAVVLVLAVGIHGLGAIGIDVAAAAIVAGCGAGCLFLTPYLRRREPGTLPADPVTTRITRNGGPPC